MKPRVLTTSSRPFDERWNQKGLMRVARLACAPQRWKRSVIQFVLLFLALEVGGVFAQQTATTASHLLFVCDFEHDSDGNGIADGWSGVKETCKLTAGPNGRCQRVTVPTEGDWLPALNSEPVPVQPGRRYRVRLRCAAEKVFNFHVKVSWLTPTGETLVQQVGDGKKYADLLTSLPNPFGKKWWWDAAAWHPYPSSERNGSWDWETWEATYEAPAGAASVRVEFLAKCKGGEFFVDEVSIEKVTPEPFGLRSIDLKSTSIPSGGRKDSDTIHLPGPVAVTLRNDADGFWGIGRVVICGVTVRDGRMPIAPVLVEREPLSYQRCVLKKIERDRDGKGAVLRTELIHADGSADQLDWLLRARKLSIDGVEATGVSYGYRFRSSTRKVHELVDRSSWSLGGELQGLEMIQQSAHVDIPPVVELVRSTILQTPLVSRIGVGDFMDFLSGANASLVTFMDKPALSFKRLARHPPGQEVLTEERFVFPLATDVTTTPRIVLLYPRGGANAWTAARDRVSTYLRREANITEVEPLPAINVSQPFDGVRGTYADAIAKSAKTLPLAKRLGFKRLFLAPSWISTATEWGIFDEAQKQKARQAAPCATIQLDIAPAYGGVEGLRFLCDAANKEGMEVIAWTATCHLSNISPLLLDHPEWIIKQRDEQPFTGGYIDITGVSLPAGYGDYALAKLKKLRQATGLHGLWLDSYSLFGTDLINYADPRWSPPFEAVVQFQIKLQKLGYVLLNEGHSPFGLPSGSFGDKHLTRIYAGREWVLYRTAPYWEAWPEAAPPPGTYFRCLANKCTPLIMDNVWLKDNALAKEGAYVNAAYVRLLPVMRRRTVLPEDGGVLWTSNDKKQCALFAFKSGWLNVGLTVASAVDVVTGENAATEDSRIQTQALHAYEITLR